MIVVIGRVVIKDGCLPQALEVSKQHVVRSRAEPGCVSHSVQQDAENPMRLVFVEEWSDMTALQVHFKVPESRLFIKALSSYAIEAPSMVLYNATAIGL